MALEILLRESDLRDMPLDLRDKILKWYFDHGVKTADTSLSPVSTQKISNRQVSVPPLREESGRVSFPEFVRAELLTPGTELMCKALKRQTRIGSKTYIEAGKVLAEGSVEYRGQRYVIPSKLALDAVNANGGNTKALNGYKYLFVRISNRLVPLEELRDIILKQHE